MKAMNWKPTLLTITCVLLGAASADARVKPFKVTGAGIAEYVPLPGDAPASHLAVGNATHLGNYCGDGAVFANAFTGPTTASFFSAVPFIFTSANGDDLAFHYGRVDFGAEEIGEVELFPAEGGKVVAVFTAEFNPVPKTVRDALKTSSLAASS